MLRILWLNDSSIVNEGDLVVKMISFIRFLNNFLLILFILIYSSDFFNKINFYEDNRQYSFSHMYRTMFVACIDTCTHTNTSHVSHRISIFGKLQKISKIPNITLTLYFSIIFTEISSIFLQRFLTKKENSNFICTFQ